MPKIFSRVSTKSRIAGDFLRFLWKRKFWWLIPFIIILLLFVALAIFAQATGLGPFIYPVI